MSFEPAALFAVALAMLVFSIAFVPGARRPNPDDLLEVVMASLGTLLQQMAFVCAVAALLVWVAPWWRAWPLEHRTLGALNEDIKYLSDWLSMLWMGPVFAAAVAIGVICLGWGVFAEAAFYYLRSPLRWSLRLQTTAALVTLVGLTGVTAERNIGGIIQETKAEINRIHELRITLAKQAAENAMIALTAQMALELPKNINLKQVSEDYRQAAPYFNLPTPSRDSIEEHFVDLQAVARQVPDLDRATLQENLKQAQTQRPQPSNGEASADVIAMLLDTSIDKTALAALRIVYHSLDHPLLNELLSALIDPVLAKPLREVVIGIAVAATRSGRGPQFLREQAKQAWDALPLAARERWSLVGERVRSAMVAAPFVARVALGNPRWQGVHEEFKRSVQEPRKPSSVDYFGLQHAWKAMAPIHEAIDRLTVDDQARQSIADIVWGRALLGRYGINDAQRDLVLTAWGQTLAWRMNLRTKDGEPDARAGLLAWYEAQPMQEASLARNMIAPVGPSNSISVPKPKYELAIKVKPSISEPSKPKR